MNERIGRIAGAEIAYIRGGAENLKEENAHAVFVSCCGSHKCEIRPRAEADIEFRSGAARN